MLPVDRLAILNNGASVLEARSLAQDAEVRINVRRFDVSVVVKIEIVAGCPFRQARPLSQHAEVAVYIERVDVSVIVEIERVTDCGRKNRYLNRHRV